VRYLEQIIRGMGAGTETEKAVNHRMCKRHKRDGRQEHPIFSLRSDAPQHTVT
jgi:hypothetical protein